MQIFYLLLFSTVTCRLNGFVDNKLRYYEIIQSKNLQHQIRKRDVDNGQDFREITLSVFGQTLSLELKKETRLFSRQFQAVTIDSEGRQHPFSFNQNEFFKGHLKGEKRKGTIVAQIHDNLLTADIEMDNDTYHIEPAFGHINDDNITDKMIAYRESDVNWNVTFPNNHTRVCGVEADLASKEDRVRRDTSSPRNRRSLKTKLMCELVLVADYLYFVNIGQKSLRKTTQSMVGTIYRVDEIFRETDFSDDPKDPYRGFGFVIKKVIIHEQPSDSGYNKIASWETNSLLEEFGRNDWSDFCLAHLFTYQDFDKGVIGLAYVANTRQGGICSTEHEGVYHNTAFSTAINFGQRLLTVENDIVTAHEFGHNFGSEHDGISDSTCAPSNGKYIMYPASVSGEKPNNKHFSPCSRRAIKQILQEKSGCFVMPDVGEFCGNYRIEGDEECDPGPVGDHCCTDKCELRDGAICSDSDYESPCCLNCQYANSSVLCSTEQQLVCKNVSYCTGKTQYCPPPEPSQAGTECIERGRCDENGECRPFCQTLTPPLESCLCSNDEDACYVCCLIDDVCKVYQNGSQRLALNDGRLCQAGVCREQKCEKEAADFVKRLKDFFGSLSDPSKFGEFLKDNIVGTIIFFSLIVWVPLSIVVNRIDKRRENHAQELARWQDAQNNELIRQPNRNKDFDVVFKKNAVFVRDSRKASPVKRVDYLR